MHSILVTGGAGFIGSNFVSGLLREQHDLRVINLDLLTYAGTRDNLQDVLDDPRHVFVQGDIADTDLVNRLFGEYDIRGVIHFAAESHVDNSIADPGVFVRTNVNGTFCLLDAARRHWMKAPFAYRDGYAASRFLHVSTDEVYGSLGSEGRFTEQSCYAPNSPYSASKASSDMLVRSYHHTYGLNTVITNCSNNYGPRQHDEKLVPTVIRMALKNQAIPIYGDGGNIRDWLYVTDHCQGVERAYFHGRAGETYNIGGDCERTNLDLAQHICTILDRMSPREDGQSYSDQIRMVADRPGHDRRYAIDAGKIHRELGWSPAHDLDEGLLLTVRWYLDKYRGNRS